MKEGCPLDRLQELKEAVYDGMDCIRIFLGPDPPPRISPLEIRIKCGPEGLDIEDLYVPIALVNPEALTASVDYSLEGAVEKVSHKMGSRKLFMVERIA